MSRFPATMVVLVVISLVTARLLSATEFECAYGNAVSANLGDGVTMQTCMWEKEPGNIVRAGPFELVKNGILILRSQTNKKGKLHGNFSSWNDAGEIMETGDYVEGLKQGPWLKVDTDGKHTTLHYDAGVLVTP